MHYLFDSRGNHIANEHEGCLYTKRGILLGRYLEQYGIFVGRDGRYLGEIYAMNRLIYDRASRHRQAFFADGLGAGGSIGTYVYPKHFTAMPLPPGLQDVDLGGWTEAS